MWGRLVDDLPALYVVDVKRAILGAMLRQRARDPLAVGGRNEEVDGGLARRIDDSPVRSGALLRPGTSVGHARDGGEVISSGGDRHGDQTRRHAEDTRLLLSIESVVTTRRWSTSVSSLAPSGWMRMTSTSAARAFTRGVRRWPARRRREQAGWRRTTERCSPPPGRWSPCHGGLDVQTSRMAVSRPAGPRATAGPHVQVAQLKEGNDLAVASSDWELTMLACMRSGSLARRTAR